MSVSLSTKTIILDVSIITHNAVCTLLKKFCIENKINKWTLHSLRQIHASMLLA